MENQDIEDYSEEEKSDNNNNLKLNWRSNFISYGGFDHLNNYTSNKSLKDELLLNWKFADISAGRINIYKFSNEIVVK